MSSRSLTSTAAFGALIVALTPAQVPLVGQAQSPATKVAPARKAWIPPRTPDGRPDLQGVWTNSTLTPLERRPGLGAKEFFTDEEFAKLVARVRQGIVGDEADLGAAVEQVLRYNLDLFGFDLTKASFASNKRTSLIVGPDGVVPPMLPEAKKRNADRVARNRGREFDGYENRPLQERCILMSQEMLPMLPGVNDNNLLEIVQTPGHVAMLHEMNHSTRVVPTDGRPHLPQNIRQWQGDSVGRWEGNTLVVDTTNFTGLSNFRGSGERLHLVERFTRVNDETMMYQFTVDDPDTWARPWTAEIPLTKVEGTVYEWSCHEGNIDLVTILRGARVAEQEAAGKAVRQAK
jgi:hypothetical protein